MAAEKKAPLQPQSNGANVDEAGQKNKQSPYPFNCRIFKAEGQPPIICQIVRVEESGIIFKAVKHFFRPAQDYKCDFDLPTTDLTINTGIKIIKTYENVEAYLPTGTKERVMTVEAHFKSIPNEVKQAIKKFVLKTGQKKI